MQIRVGCEFKYDVKSPTSAVLQVQPHSEAPLYESLSSQPSYPFHVYLDLYGNMCQRIELPAGPVTLRYDARAEVTGELDAADVSAPEMPVQSLPDHTLVYTLPSRYCLSDTLGDAAWELFGHIAPGYGRVQAICDWVHDNIRFQYGTSTPQTTAVDVYERRVGVCRDFAHLATTFCRALNIPTRYTFGYLPDVGVPVAPEPMDFAAWIEVYLGGRWFTFDPRNNKRRIGRVVIGRGRDALDVAMVTTYGSLDLKEMTVWADEISSSMPALIGTPDELMKAVTGE